MKAELWSTIESGSHDVRLVVCDMDGTLLDDKGAVPETFWSLVDEMDRRGIVFAPASGRQYATLARMFEAHDSVRTFIADNGTKVIQDGEAVSLTPIERDTAVRVIDDVRRATHRDLGLVVGGAERAYVERKDDRFVNEAARYNIDLEIVDDLKDVDDHFLKMATFDFDGVEGIVDDVFPGDWDGAQVVVSATHWIDVMSNRANKGTAVVDLQKHLDVTPAQTVVFGDFLNDLEMIQQAELSFAMENAHQGILDAARYIAPSNSEHGVVTVLKHMLNL
ncbi:Cof-type HAD-IIB family hydrolase [Flaviflexus salsibiostraticola]|nr:Cof-type HAD-IIB family hydrolase [Flaviflexus salsibiostraticola]